MKNQDYAKLSSHIRGWMLGRNYFQAVKAMEFAKGYHTGMRKDKVTPEFQHQVSQASYARTLEPSFLFPEATFCTIWLHDTPEDYDVPHKTIKEIFGEQVSVSVELMTNQVGGDKKPSEIYYKAMAFDPIASLAKGIDRIHNHQTMTGVFTPVKQLSYVLETETFILPMLKAARKRFPEQDAAYQNIRHVLLSQIELIKAIHEDSYTSQTQGHNPQ